MTSRPLKVIKGAKEGDLERVTSLLLRKETVVDEEDELGLTPLIWASHEGHLEVRANPPLPHVLGISLALHAATTSSAAITPPPCHSGLCRIGMKKTFFSFTRL